MTRDNRTEHETDPRDTADAFFLLDDGEARLGLSECCHRVICTCDDWDRPERHRRPVRPYPSRVITDR